MKKNLKNCVTEGISSDEDEVDELGNSYYERVSELAKAKGAAEGFEISAEVKVRHFFIENVQNFKSFF